MEISGAPQVTTLQYVVPHAEHREIIRQLHSGDNSGHLVLRRLSVGSGSDIIGLDIGLMWSCSARNAPLAPVARVQHPDIAHLYRVCRLDTSCSWWVEAYAIPNQEASTIARVLVDEVSAILGHRDSYTLTKVDNSSPS